MDCTNAHIGRLEAIGIWKETTSGTKVAAAYWLQRVSGSVNPIIEKYIDEGVLGVIESQSESHVTMETSETSVELPARDQYLWELLIGAFGAQSVATNADASNAVFDHTFTVLQNNNHPSYSVYSYSPIATEVSTFNKIEEFWISASKWEEVKVNVTLKGRALETESTPTVSYTDDNIFLAKHVTLKYADTEAWLASATALSLDSFNFTINKNIEMLGIGETPDCITNQNFVISGSIEATYTNNDWYNLVKNSTKKFFQIIINNTDVTIGTSARPKLVITFAKASFDEVTKSDDLNAIVKQTVNFIGLFNNDSGYSVKAVLTNTVAWTY